MIYLLAFFIVISIFVLTPNISFSETNKCNFIVNSYNTNNSHIFSFKLTPNFFAGNATASAVDTTTSNGFNSTNDDFQETPSKIIISKDFGNKTEFVVPCKSYPKVQIKYPLIINELLLKITSYDDRTLKLKIPKSFANSPFNVEVNNQTVNVQEMDRINSTELFIDLFQPFDSTEPTEHIIKINQVR